MNLCETKQMLTMLWSLYPNAPKLSKDDKEVMAMAWLAVLYEYSLEDVWRAARRCFERESRFVPTAPDVLKHCEKTYHTERFLPAKYTSLLESVDLSISAEMRRERLIKGYSKRSDLDADERQQLETVTRERQQIRELDAMWREAHSAAQVAYDQTERAKLADDGSVSRLKMLALT